MNQFCPTRNALVTRPAVEQPEVELAPPVLRSWDDMVAQGFRPVPPDPVQRTLTRVLAEVAEAAERRR